MTTGTDSQWQSLERLSAVMDGEGDDAALDAACTAWREGSSLCASWHAYHLIGDVLRCEDLARDADRDAAFVRSLRERLAAEPVVLAPSAGHQRVMWWRTWSAPAAVAAGFVAVAGVVFVTQTPLPAAPTTSAPLALAGAPADTRAVAAAQASSGAEPPLVIDGRVLRDVRLQQYLAAHKQFGGSSALGVPSGFLRSATVDTPGR